MNSRTVRRACVSIAAAAALTGVAACGGGSAGKGESKGAGEGGGSLNPLAALRTVDSKTQDADSAKVDGTTTMGAQGSMEMKGGLDWSDGVTGALRITFTDGPMADQMQQAGDTSIDYRYLKNGYYANMGEKFAAASGGKRWIEYDYDTLAEMGGASGQALKNQMQSSTPNQTVKMLLASGDVKRVGDEKVRGVDATHYSGTVDVADLTAKNAGMDEKEAADLRKQLQDAGMTTEKIDIWVDDEDLLVKKVEEAKMKNGEFSQTVYYSDYGVDVATEEPPADETVNVKDLMKQQPQQ
ncbi:hypothetical protein [Streptomyces cavernicola]|uniref:Lipoprotein n=1 Tax=Streptomyces cavernicola TaxID=3043613 RepID=A0ABT6SM92_9ACTN|nr:hypothetical protein [Streptomyces sp. B-S-A6]MDI3408533.1 hypothetical protein [Streptomyces sp. B-S-A6]